jgi:exosortase
MKMPMPPWVLLLAMVWAVACWRWSLEWRIHEQYGYGWFMPLLALYLVFRRWADRPLPVPLPCPWGVVGVILGLWLPLRWLGEANPDWRLLAWGTYMLAAGLTVWVLVRGGGWGWVRHFGWPVAFMALAVPWPAGLETWAVQRLMQAVAVVTAEGLNFCGIIAWRQGNIIHLADGMVGVDEACSGVRSLQSTLMMAVFWGDYFRLAWCWRLGLLAGGLAVAFALNLIRALFLALVGAGAGEGVLVSWHDPAGWVQLGAAFVVLYGMAWILGRKMEAPEPTASGPVISIPGRRVAWAGVGWLVLVELFCVFWFAVPRGGEREPRWIAWQSQAPFLAEKAVPGRVASILRTERAVRWTGREGGFYWDLYDLYWAPGPSSVQLAAGHTPEICLPAAGAELHEEKILRLEEGPEGGWPVRRFWFRYGDTDVHVYYVAWDEAGDVFIRTGSGDYYSRAERVRAAWRGRKNLGQHVIQVSVVGGEPGAADRQVMPILSAALSGVLR